MRCWVVALLVHVSSVSCMYFGLFGMQILVIYNDVWDNLIGIAVLCISVSPFLLGVKTK